jgi:DNA-binding GntR family transcriptional regulator
LPRRGVIIRFNSSWAEEMILARAALESMIAHLAAKRLGKDAVASIEATVERMRVATENGEADELISLNEIFHDQIHVASQCQYLSRMIERQQFYDASIRRVIHSDPDERQKAFKEHAAIARGDHFGRHRSGRACDARSRGPLGRHLSGHYFQKEGGHLT